MGLIQEDRFHTELCLSAGGSVASLVSDSSVRAESGCNELVTIFDMGICSCVCSVHQLCSSGDAVCIQKQIFLSVLKIRIHTVIQK